ncbi:hypothetical protein [Streptococcus oralis]|uniref:hypothetical protein n=1 Tax=Streptococcus oralis TaxID=1303 RepID=UPI0034A10D7D
MNEQEATEFFSKQEEVKKEILNEIEEYKQDYTSISSDMFLTTRQKEKQLENDFKKREKSIIEKTLVYFKDWKEFSQSKILPLVADMVKTLKGGGELYRAVVFDFLDELQSFYTMESYKVTAEGFLRSQLPEEYHVKLLEGKFKDKYYYIGKGQQRYYEQAILKELEHYNLSPDMVLWSDLLLEELVQDDKIKGHSVEEFTEYISGVVDDFIDQKEQELIKQREVFNDLPEKKRNIISKFFRQ